MFAVTHPSFLKILNLPLLYHYQYFNNYIFCKLPLIMMKLSIVGLYTVSAVRVHMDGLNDDSTTDHSSDPSDECQREFDMMEAARRKKQEKYNTDDECERDEMMEALQRVMQRASTQPDEYNVVKRIENLHSECHAFEREHIETNVGFSYEFDGSLAHQMHAKLMEIMKPEENGEFVVLSIGSGYFPESDEGGFAEAKWREMYPDINIISTDILAPMEITRPSKIFMESARKDVLAGRFIESWKNKVFNLDATKYEACETAVKTITEEFGIDANRIVVFSAWPDNAGEFFFKDAMANFKRLGVGHVMLDSFSYAQNAFFGPLIPVNRDEHIPFFKMEEAPVRGGVQVHGFDQWKMHMGNPDEVFRFMTSPESHKPCVLAFGQHSDAELQHYKDVIAMAQEKQEEVRAQVRAVMSDLSKYEKPIQIGPATYQLHDIQQFAAGVFHKLESIQDMQLQNNLREFFLIADLQQAEI